ncbi:unnamed protein product [Hyaloperonospora brassicae]|uniref:RxLR effector candidate protein n=1 Tax=Hyaloperonospora brassicae TaxID=162125 RepID=A0AAV0TBB8_HYABA|nr:unnamed protein product [Hyaloperonospora brassicae]
MHPIVLRLLLALFLSAGVTGQRLISDPDDGQVVRYPSPHFLLDDPIAQGKALAYLQDQGVNTSIEAQSWKQEHGYASLRAMLDDQSLYHVSKDASFDCGFTSLQSETQDIPTNGTFESSGYTLDGPCEVWLDDTQVIAGRNCRTEFPLGQHEVDYSSCGDSCTLRWYWLGIRYVDGIYSWQVYKNCVGLGKKHETA